MTSQRCNCDYVTVVFFNHVRQKCFRCLKITIVLDFNYSLANYSEQNLIESIVYLLTQKWDMMFTLNDRSMR